MYQIAMNACQNANFVPNIVFTSHRIDSILDMVTNQNCIALLMDAHLKLPENGPRQTGEPWHIVLLLRLFPPRFLSVTGMISYFPKTHSFS